MTIFLSARFSAVLLAVFLTFPAGPSRADSDAEANALFVGAVLAWDEVNSITSDGAEAQTERLRLIQLANGNLHAIVADHPGSDLAVRLVIGDSIGAVSLPEISAALEEAENLAAQAGHWADCLASPSPDCILAEAILQAEEVVANGGEPVGYSSIAAAQAQMGQIDAARDSLARLTSPWDRDNAQIYILRAQVSAGDFTDAAITLDAISTGVPQSIALRDLAKAQAAAGLVDDARATLARAVDLAQRNDDVDLHMRNLVQIGRVQAEAGLFGDAFSTASLISDPEALDELLSQIAGAQAKAGFYDEARATLGGIGTPDMLASAQSLIATAEARAGLLDKALATAREIADGSRRAMTLATVARQQVVSGIDPATTIAEAHDALASDVEVGNWDKSFALNAISIAEIVTGLPEAARDSFSQAMATANEIQGTETRSYVLTGLAQNQTGDGSADLAAEAFAAARLLLSESDDPRFILSRFTTVATAEQLSGVADASQTWADALTLARTISDDAYRVSAIAELAAAFARAETMRAEYLAETP